MSNQTINNLISIQEDIKKNNDLNKVKIVAVTKTFSMEKIKPLIDFGHIHFGENKFQEAAGKWNEQIRNNKLKGDAFYFLFDIAPNNKRLFQVLSKQRNNDSLSRRTSIRLKDDRWLG